MTSNSGQSRATDDSNVEKPAAVWLDPANLNAWPDNPRLNDGEPIRRVMESIKRFGFGAPIVARTANMEIIAGHTRWKAAVALKLTRVPVRLLDISEREAHLLALADNRLTELTEWSGTLSSALSEFSLQEAEIAGWKQTDLDAMAKDLLGDEPAADESEKLNQGFAVLIECADEDEQLDVIARCEGIGLKCRALT